MTDTAKGPARMTTALADGNNDFALDLYHQLQSQPGNLFFSPYGVSTALTLALGGAEGETKDQIIKTLHFTLDSTKIHTMFNGQELSITRHAPTSRVQMKFATRLWAQTGTQFQEPFSKFTQHYYDAEPETLDFSKPMPRGKRSTLGPPTKPSTRFTI